ncbi:hypothetical protein EDC96DRAFT_548171 [Choanephora cucurbitarum]|nr:hypothetical protein EDC96DRAFT_548171 [Choanephora cucurbitarum]
MSILDSFSCQCESINGKEHVLEHHVEQILRDYLQPSFKQQTSIHPSIVKKPTLRYATQPELHQDQLWKQQDQLEILSSIVQSISTTDLHNHIGLILPPVLIVLDDYDPEYKMQGVKMVHAIVTKLHPSFVVRFGLDSLFLESLFKCLTYLSDDRDRPLLRSAYPCILELISKMEKDEQKRQALFERVLREGVLTGFLYAGQKIKFLPILMEPIATLYQEIGIVGVQYLKALIPTLCQTLNISGQKPLHSLALQSLVAIMRTCWPRIPFYHGQIMAAIAKSWYEYSEIQDQRGL